MLAKGAKSLTENIKSAYSDRIQTSIHKHALHIYTNIHARHIVPSISPINRILIATPVCVVHTAFRSLAIWREHIRWLPSRSQLTYLRSLFLSTAAAHSYYYYYFSFIFVFVFVSLFLILFWHAINSFMHTNAVCIKICTHT